MASSPWEEADCEFYSEAFLRDKDNGRSHSSTLESNYDRSEAHSVDTVIHRPPPQSDGGQGSKILTAAARAAAIASGGGTSSSNHNNFSKRGSLPGTGSLGSLGSSKGGRSARMKASIQGLGSEDSDQENEGGDEYWLYGSSGGGGGGKGGGEPRGSEVFLSGEFVLIQLYAYNIAIFCQREMYHLFYYLIYIRIHVVRVSYSCRLQDLGSCIFITICIVHN